MLLFSIIFFILVCVIHYNGDNTVFMVLDLVSLYLIFAILCRCGVVTTPSFHFPFFSTAHWWFLLPSEANHHWFCFLGSLYFSSEFCFPSCYLVVVSLCRLYLGSENGQKTTQKVLVFLPKIHWIYRWVELEVLGILLVVTSKFLWSLREESLITPEDEYEEDYALGVPGENESVCNINHGRGPNWMPMYKVLITKLNI